LNVKPRDFTGYFTPLSGNECIQCISFSASEANPQQHRAGLYNTPLMLELDVSVLLIFIALFLFINDAYGQ
jgi:hypothetical protein